MCVHWSTISPSCELLWLNVLPAIKLPTIRIIRTRHYNAYNHRISYSKEVEHFSAINTWAHHRAPKFFRRRGWDHLGYRGPSWHRAHLNPNDREAMWPRFPETLCEVTHQIIQLISQAAIGKISDFRFLMISPYFSSYFPSKDPWWRRPNWVDPVGRCHGTGTVRSLREHVNNLHRDPADDPIQRSNSPTWKIIFMDISICSCPLCTCVRIYVCIYIYIIMNLYLCVCVWVFVCVPTEKCWKRDGFHVISPILCSLGCWRPQPCFIKTRWLVNPIDANAPSTHCACVDIAKGRQR